MGFTLLNVFKYNCVDFEGPDQVGKGDAVENFSNYLSSLGLTVSAIAFPYYASPFGYIIRDILKNGFPSSIALSKDREIQIKMALFALNRLEILDCIFSSNKTDIYLFDRGPFSNALTISYHIFANPKDKKNISKYIDFALSYDSYFRELLNLDNCVICLKHDGILWEKNREKDGGDLHERKEVQEISSYVYKLFEKKVGKGWSNVVTKDKSGWKDRGQIVRECYNFALKKGVITESQSNERVPIEYLGIKEVQNFLYKGSRVDSGLVSSWLDAIRLNDKKQVYILSESISHALAGSTRSLKWGDRGIVKKVNEILKDLPEIFDIIEHMYGKSFLSKFTKSLK